MPITPQQAAQELLNRRKARRSLVDYARYISVPGAPVEEQDEDSDTTDYFAETVLAEHHVLILEAAQRCIEKPYWRLMLFMPPGSAKSSYGSVVVPSWCMGQKPGFKVIGVSYGSDMAKKFGRRTRSIIKQSKYRACFGTSLSGDQAAADEWALDNGSEYMSGGILSGITGNRADLVVIDDPIKGRQDADSEVIRQRTWDEYQESVLTRLKPSGSVVIIQCMVGDTPVLLPDGSEKELKDIRPGDMVATYDKGSISSAKVINHINNGPDLVYEIRTICGITVRANERHPFLVERNGELQWIRLRDLSLTDAIVKATGKEKLASTKDAIVKLEPRVTALATTTKQDGLADIERLPSTLNRIGQLTSSIGTASPFQNTTQCLNPKVGFAQFVNKTEKKDHLSTGLVFSASTTATTVKKLEGCFATIATLSSEEVRHQKLSEELRTTSIVEIRACGFEDVYDVQIEGTENFIANGLVSHNTRWHEDDLSGRILPDNYAGESGIIMGKDGFEWEVICLAAECERLDDPLGRKVGQMLWEEWFDEKHWSVHRKNPRTWSALFQQRPAPDSGDYFKKEWIKLVSASQVPPLNTMSIYGASDYAVTNNGGDYTVHVVVGVDSEGRIWLLDIWRQQASSDRWVDSFCDLVRKWKPIGWAEETGQIKSGVGPFLVKRMLETGSYVAREQFPTRGGDKSVRAQSIRGRIALSGLYVRDDLPGLDALMSEMMSFPVGVHDDQVDALGLVGQLMDRMTPGKPQKKPERMDYSAVYASPLPGQRKRG